MRLNANIELRKENHTDLPCDLDIIADENGIQVNVNIDGLCHYRINLDNTLKFAIINHTDDEKKVEMNL